MSPDRSDQGDELDRIASSQRLMAAEAAATYLPSTARSTAMALLRTRKPTRLSTARPLTQITAARTCAKWTQIFQPTDSSAQAYVAVTLTGLKILVRTARELEPSRLVGPR